MTTQAQIEANRLNAQKSTGPKTPAGKAHSSLNALKHGIRATGFAASLRRTPLFDEDPQEFARLVQDLVDHYHPEGPIEQTCVEDLAINIWRLRRVACAETGHIASAQTILLSGPGADNPRLRERNALPDFAVLEKLTRYETTLQRQFKRSLDTLNALIRERSQGGQANPPSQPKQRADQSLSIPVQQQKDEIASIRREVLSCLLADLGSRATDPESGSVALPEEGPNKANPRSPAPVPDPSPDAQHPAPVSAERSRLPFTCPDACSDTSASEQIIDAGTTAEMPNKPKMSVQALRKLIHEALADQSSPETHPSPASAERSQSSAIAPDGPSAKELIAEGYLPPSAGSAVP